MFKPQPTMLGWKKKTRRYIKRTHTHTRMHAHHLTGTCILVFFWKITISLRNMMPCWNRFPTVEYASVFSFTCNMVRTCIIYYSFKAFLCCCLQLCSVVAYLIFLYNSRSCFVFTLMLLAYQNLSILRCAG